MRHVTQLRWMIPITIIFVATCFSAVAQSPTISRTEARRIIEFFIALSCAPYDDPVVDGYLKAMRENPDVFEPILGEELDAFTQAPLASLSPESLERCGQVVGLISYLGPEHAAKHIQDVFSASIRHIHELRTHADRMKDATGTTQEPLHEVSGQLYSIMTGLTNRCLNRLEEFRDPFAVDHCLNMAGQFHGPNGEVGATQFVMLRYFETVAPLRPDIRPKLEELYTSPESKLRNDPQLKRALEAMDAAESAKAGESKPDGDADRTRDRGEDESDRSPHDRDRNK